MSDQSLGIIGRSNAEDSDHRHRHVLRSRRNRPRRRCAAYNELAPSDHSITSSARARSQLRSSHAFDNTNVALRTLIESPERFLVGRAFQGGLGVGSAVELDDNCAEVKPGLKCLHWVPANEKTTSKRLHGRACQLDICG